MRRLARPAMIAGFWSLTSVCLLLVVEVTVAYVDGPPVEFWGFPFPWLMDCQYTSLCVSVHAGFFTLDFLILFALWMLAVRFIPSLATRRAGQVAAWGGAVASALFLTVVLSTHESPVVFFAGFDDWFGFGSITRIVDYAYSIDIP